MLAFWMHFVASRFCNHAFLFWPTYAYVFVQGEGVDTPTHLINIFEILLMELTRLHSEERQGQATQGN